jgi:opacity protein-like surface antigen
MKRSFIIVLMIFCSIKLVAQENRFTLSGGYVFTNLEEADQKATGFRINSLYELNPIEGKVAHGFNFGYLRTTATNTVLGVTSDYTITNFPVYYAPKLILGEGPFRIFLKGALGFHYSSFKRVGGISDIKTWDFGFYGGAGPGFMVSIKENVFLNAEYEWAYMSNTSFRDGFVNTIMGGIGFKF